MIKPVKKGEFYSIHVGEDLYSDSAKNYVDSLIGHVIYSKGEKPLPTLELQRKLETIWEMSSPLRLLPLGRGYFNIHFGSNEERNKAFLRQSWAMKPGLLRLHKWVPNFNPYKVNSSTAQVWVRVFELPIEYWCQAVFEGIASALGTLIWVDDRTIRKEMYHYVRLLVEVDLKNPLQDKIMIERPGYCLFAYFQYERLPEFCKNCGIIGHSACRCNSKDPSRP